MLAELNRNQQDFNVFVEHMPFGTDISGVSLSNVPQEALGLLQQKATLYLFNKDLKFDPADLQNLAVITHPDGARTYVAQSISTYSKGRRYSNPEDLSKEELTHLADVSADDNLMGWGHIRKLLVHKTLPTNQPFVGFTYTDQDGSVNYRNRGFGTRRLLTMNALSAMYYGMPLYSSGLISREEESVWKHLVDRRIASSFRHVNDVGWLSTRYVFRG